MGKSVDKGKLFRDLLIDLVRALDSLPHYLITTDLTAYKFSFSAARLSQNYLSNKK